VASGEYDASDNPLKNAPHTAEMLIAGEWKHPYPAAEGGYPWGAPGTHRQGAHGPHARPKYWPPVRRIDSAYGDRHLVCACPAPEAFEG
jgi:glycine dehydrogenase